MRYKNLFTPVKIGSLIIKNRFAMAPMGPLGLSDSQGASTSAESITTRNAPRAAPA